MANDLQDETFRTLTLLVNKLSSQALDHSSTIAIFEHIADRLDQMVLELASSSSLRTTAQSHLRLAVAYDTIGPTDKSLTTLTKAHHHFLEAINLLEPIAEAESSILISAYDGLAANCIKRGAVDDAEKHFNKVSALCLKLLAQRPDDPQLLRIHSVYWESLSEVARHRGNVAKRREYLENCLQIRERLAKLDTTSTQFKYNLAGVLLLLGDTVRSENQEQAAVHYRRSMQLSEQAVQQEPQNIPYMRSLANGYDRQRLVSPVTEKLDWSNKALAIREKIIRLEPIERTSLNDLLVSYLGVFDQTFKSESADPQASKRILDLASEQAERWYGLASDDQKASMFLSRVELAYSDWYRKQGQTDMALTHCQRAVQLRRQVVQQTPSGNNRRYLLVGLESLVEIYTELTKHPEALAVSEDQLQILEHMISAGELPNEMPAWKEDVEKRIEQLKSM